MRAPERDKLLFPTKVRGGYRYNRLLRAATVFTSSADGGVTPRLVETVGSSRLSAGLRVLYGATIFLSAFLLFLLEPLFAKLILPWFGGTAAVWATCLVFYQSALLAGYWYANVLARRFAPRRASAMHLGLLVASLAFLPIAPMAFWRGHASVDPAWRILGLLACSIGLPFFALSATSPLVQAWYGRRAAGDPTGTQRSPYHLYAISNVASLVALLSFPLVLERWVPTHRQAVLWSSLYGAFVVLCAIAAWVSRSGSARNSSEHRNLQSESRAESLFMTKSYDESCPGKSDPAGPDAMTKHERRAARLYTWPEKMLWVALAACGSMALLAVTNHLATNVAPIPLLWVIPLAVYLLSFALVFAKQRWYSSWLTARMLAVMLGAAGYAMYDSTLTQAIQVGVPVFCLLLFVICLFCHGELAARRPSPEHLTSFYLWMAGGAALGSISVALLAPHLLTGVYELPFVLVLAAVLGAMVLWNEGWGARIFWSAMAACMCGVLISNVRTSRQDSMALVRDFYAALRIQDFTANRKLPFRLLIHGTIQHGGQFLTWPENRNPTLYYGRKSGVGLALRFCCDGPKRVGVVGLGAGTLAAYGKPGDYFRFYEIDPQVVRIARGWFSFLKQSPAQKDIVLGDARLSLESEPSQQFDVLAVDAFSGDAIPVHLLTREAFAVYFRHLKTDGILALHVSNTYLDLAPVVDLLAEDADYATRLISSDDDDTALISAADWVLVTRNQGFLNVPETFVGSRNIQVPPKLRLWTDDYNNLFEVLRTVKYINRPHGDS
jgi:SAM-dependent methyltransferase